MPSLFFSAYFSGPYMEKSNKNFGGITMITLEKIVYNTVVGYHAAMIDINRCLFVTGLRSDEKSEAVAEHHCSSILHQRSYQKIRISNQVI